MNADHHQARMILGSGRSGTTWVLDCLAAANELRPVFEPLHPQESQLAARFAYDVLARDDKEDELKRYFLELAEGSIHTRWIDYRVPKSQFRPRLSRLLSEAGYAKRWLRRWQSYLHDRRALRHAVRRQYTLIKCIRANLMASWLTREVGFRTALIVRHPCAVVESQYRLQWGMIWDPMPVLERYRTNRRLDEHTNGRYRHLFAVDLTTLQALTLNWVIENQWPVERSAIDGFSVIFYERLLSDPESSWPTLCNALCLEQVPGHSLLRKPSQQASKETESAASSHRQAGWRSRLTPEQLRSIQGILDATNCHLYSVDDPNPLIS